MGSSYRRDVTEADPEPRVVRNDERRRYELRVGPDLAAYSAFREPGGDRAGEIVFTHTEVGEAFGGRGLGTRLVTAAVEDAIERDRRIVPLCPFVGKVLRRTQAYDEYVRWPSDSGHE